MISGIKAKDKWNDDLKKKETAESLGIRIVTIWESELDSDPDSVKEKIREIVSVF